MPRFSLITLLVVALLLGGPLAPTAQAATACAGELQDIKIIGNLVVPAGRQCILTDVTITGSVTVEESAFFVPVRASIGGNLTAAGNADLDLVTTTVNGKLTATNASRVRMRALGGRMIIKGAVTISGTQRIAIFSEGQDGITVGGTVNLTNNNTVELGFTDFGGQVTVINNQYTTLDTNRINGKLSCSGNIEIFGRNNTATGGALSQCATLQPVP